MATILDSITEGVFTVDRDWNITYFNRAAEEITGIERGEALGRKCFEVFRASVCEQGCYLRRTLESGEPGLGQAAYIVNARGERLPISISTAVLRDERGRPVGGVETFRNLSVVETLRQELAQRYTFHDIVSKNARMQQMLSILPRVALSDATVLVSGASGTGKELVARAIHDLSRRRQGPLVTVNCAALPDNLLESELFGHAAGAFTDARQEYPGRFLQADGGTIFLDEIGEMSPALQAKLLRVLQERVVEPLGSTRSRPVDVRVIAATNRDLGRLVKGGRFRQDLFFRLNVVNLHLPPLRERREDIPLLVEHFIARFNRLQGREVVRMAPEALAILMEHDFPGNVRELQNIVEHAFVLSSGDILLPEHLPEPLRPPSRPAGPGPVAERASLRDIEAAVIRSTLERCGNNRQRTARELGIHPTTLWRKMKKLSIG
ncbi:MAG: Fis family transcriptional regulator [Deltaproteobacteria bacterium]|nr:MAG: Fis family transcriptional regulator [Deltaproteobacteria bacterium]